jgi:hypothetical protein
LTSKPNKKNKRDKKSKEPVSKFKYQIEDNLIFISHTHEKQYGQECIVLERHRSHIQYYYKIQFQDETIIDTAEATLKTIEEYEEYLLEIENKKSVSNDSDNLIYDNHGNYAQCLIPTVFYEMRCHECGEKLKCVYKNKDNYRALKNLR